jgi:hypothetical protein
MNKRSVKILVLAVVAAIITGAIFWAIRPKSALAPAPGPNLASSETAISANASSSQTIAKLETQTADWQFYSNSERGFSFKYPVDFGANVWKPEIWPPAVTVVGANIDPIEAGCPNLQKSSDDAPAKNSSATPYGIPYSLYIGSNIGAGQLYSEYCYVIADKQGGNIVIDFLVHSHTGCGFGGCGAYCGTQYENECTNLNRFKDIISPIRSMVNTFSFVAKN